MKQKSNIYELFTIAILFTLISTRFFCVNTNWIDAVNFAGLITACISLYFDTYEMCKNYRKVNMFTGISIFALAILVVLEVLIIIKVLNISALWNDIITLGALLVSLPANLYKKILAELLK